jgi:hypothetical protein
MNTKKKFSVFIILIFYIKISLSNPVISNSINEFGFTASGWKLEIYAWNYPDGQSFDNFYLTSTTDTAYFKSGITNSSDYLVITPDSLETDLSINTLNDTISLYEPDENYFAGRIFFKESSFPPSPFIGQSFCLVVEGIGLDIYLDNSPTYGAANDTTDSQGKAIVQVTDSSGSPLEGIFVWENHTGKLDTRLAHTEYKTIGATDVNGNFNIKGLSGFHYYWLNDKDTIFNSTEGFIKRVPIFPDSTISRTVIVDFTLSATNHENSTGIITRYKLSNNYPNPFNNSTTFTYQVPIDDYVEINLYDIQGRLVKTLESGFKTAGKYQVEFGASNLSSGIFFYRLETANKTITRKCMFLK